MICFNCQHSLPRNITPNSNNRKHLNFSRIYTNSKFLFQMGHSKRRRKWPCGGRKRKYLCKRKRKATTRRCCPGGIRSKVTICNRNWRRISVKPFINFLRVFRRGKYDWPLSKLLKEGRKKWCRLSTDQKVKYVMEACRARKRGYRTWLRELKIKTQNFLCLFWCCDYLNIYMSIN